MSSLIDMALDASYLEIAVLVLVVSHNENSINTRYQCLIYTVIYTKMSLYH